MSKHLAVVDTSVILLVVAPIDDKSPPELPGRQRNAIDRMTRLREDGYAFVVPAPVISELCRSGPGDALADSVLRRFGGARVEAFDQQAALVTGEMLRPALAAKAPGEGRHAMKYDAMIAGLAHALEAKYLVTANARDFAKYLAVVRSPIEIVRADEAEPAGPLFLVKKA